MENEITEMPATPQEWKPTRSEYLRQHEIRIRFLALGCVISVGCKEIPFTTIKHGIAALNDYIQNPYSVGKSWEEKFQKEEE